MWYQPRHDEVLRRDEAADPALKSQLQHSDLLFHLLHGLLYYPVRSGFRDLRGLEHDLLLSLVPDLIS
eukprot:11098045-Heterocapsa_arctica.AAC.1